MPTPIGTYRDLGPRTALESSKWSGELTAKRHVMRGAYAGSPPDVCQRSRTEELPR